MLSKALGNNINMNEAIYFKTSMFDVSQEDGNPVNPIYGQSLLLWLKEKLAETILLDEIGTEDWGWYSSITWKNRNYIIGSTAYFEKGNNPKIEIEWAFQVNKTRTFKEKLLGKERMTVNDPCFQFFKELFENEPMIHNVEVG